MKPIKIILQLNDEMRLCESKIEIEDFKDTSTAIGVTIPKHHAHHWVIEDEDFPAFVEALRMRLEFLQRRGRCAGK